MARRRPPPTGGRPPDLPSNRYSEQFQVIEGGVNGRLDDYDAWPVSPFKLELECADIYQDVTGVSLDELENRGEIEYEEFDNHRYFVSPSVSSPTPEPGIREATNRFYEFFHDQSNAHFAELATYVALCKIYDELPIAIDVHPKGQYQRKLRGKDDELDAFMEIFQERFPFEVYNGFQFVDDEHSKLSQIESLHSEDEPLINPVLVNRLSSPFSKEEIPKNALIIDTDVILGCESNNPDFIDTIEPLNIVSHFEMIPEFETEDGVQIDGNDWNAGPSNYTEVVPSKLVSAASELPDSFLCSVRGGVQFQYVSTLFRRMSEPVDQVAATLIQDSYHHLLRHPNGTSPGDVIDIGWSSYLHRHTRTKTDVTRFEPDIRERARELLTRLRRDKIVVERNGSLYARKAVHPHTSFDFSP